MPSRRHPRHRLQTNLADYLAVAGQLLRPDPTHVDRFEREFAEFVTARHAIAVSSGRFALDLIIRHLDLPAGAEVIVPAFNYFAVVERFVAAGLKPVFADVRASDLNIDPADVRALVTEKTRVILATHMFGHPCDLHALREIARDHDLIVIEDCAHALGSRLADRHVGTFGRASLFSLSVMKMITGFGGGVLVTDDKTLAERIRQDLRRSPRIAPITTRVKRFAKGALLDVGTRSLTFDLAAWPILRAARMIKSDFQQKLMTEVPTRATAKRPSAPHLDAFQARLARNLLRRIQPVIDGRTSVSRKLAHALADIDGVRTLRPIDGGRDNGMYFGLLVDHPEQLARTLFAAGIDSETAEYRNCADLEIYSRSRRDCPVAQNVENRILRLPNNPDMNDDAVNRIAEIVRRHTTQTQRLVPNRSPSLATAQP